MGYLSRYLDWYFKPKFDYFLCLSWRVDSSWDQYKKQHPIIDYGTSEFISDFSICNLALGVTLALLVVPTTAVLHFHAPECLLTLMISFVLQSAAILADIALNIQRPSLSR